MISRFIGLCGLSGLLLANSIDAQQVVFSRREYAARGTTFEQLWTWSASDGHLTQLTRSARDHRNPVCSPDGTQIFFDSATDPLAQRHWRFDRETGIERPTNDAPPHTEIVRLDTLNIRLPACGDRTWSQAPDGSRGACTADGVDLVIVDLTTRKEIDRIPFDQKRSTGEPYPPWPLQSTWSPNGQMLLVGTYGEGSSSTIAKLDFFLLDLSTKTWMRAMTGNNPVWLPNGDAIIYETPRDLVPLPPTGRRRVWSAHLARFDLATRTEARLTSGVANNVRPGVCGH